MVGIYIPKYDNNPLSFENLKNSNATMTAEEAIKHAESISKNNMTNIANNAYGLGVGDTYYVPNNYANATSTDQGIQNATMMDYYEYLSNTEMQRRVVDLQRAGLNPVLAATGLGGASSATSAMSNSTRQTDSTNKTNLLSTAISLIAAIALKKG